MKSKFQIIAAVVCAAVLAACGGGGSKTPAVVVVAQPTYKVTETVVGTGLTAETGDLVVINFVGYLYDSTKADGKGAKVESSVDTGKTAAPFTIGVGAVVTGWDQSILGMKVGGKRTAILPANLAYGAVAHTALPAIGNITYAAIPANSPLVYDFELVDVTKAVLPVVVPPPTTLKIVDTLVGSGAAAANGKTLSVNYTLYVYDGTRADFRGPAVQTTVGATPFSFQLGAGKVIAGWEQGVPGMLVGGKRTLTVPPSLGYGTTAQSGIPANSTLIFDIELLSVQ
ncbi:MAG: FKBP-type peptidyl-prolyl cis-trans isomerase [Pseudomonadota bacterium]|jgi:peptidylprolyl isomerase